MNVVVIPSRIEVNARTNLEALVERARALNVYGPSVDFDAVVWDLSAIKPAKPAAGSAKAKRLYFTTHENGAAKSLRGRTPLAKHFADMLKAVVVMREHGRPRDVGDPKILIRASRAVHQQLANRGHDPALLVSTDFVKAANSFKGRFTDHTCYTLGNKLEQLAEAVNLYNLSKARILFKNPYKRVDFNYRVVDETERARIAKKMASDDAIDAIISMSLAVRETQNDYDVLCSSVAELDLCGPWRINDLLNILDDCERTELAPDGTGERLGFAFSGSKGVKGAMKWVASAMKPIAERALADIRRITAPARMVARFMERHPGRAWLPKPWRLADPETLLDSNALKTALNLSDFRSAIQWAHWRGIKPARTHYGKHFYRLADIERAVLEMQPKLLGLPPLSKWLFIVPRNFGAETRGANLPIVRFLTDQMFSDFMVGRGMTKSIFERLGLIDADGNPYAVRSHQIRHFLNNIAHEGRLPQIDIARWSGRKDVGQNEVYDHTGGIPLARTMRQVLESGAMQGPVAATLEKLPPVDRAEFVKSRLATVHMTDIGACIQDWSLAPCPSHGACASCSDHLVIKGDKKQRERAEQLLGDCEPLVADAERETADGTYGAAPWVEHNKKMVEGLKQVLAVHDDASIPDGTPVQTAAPRNPAFRGP